jgi:hypothetical protein
MKTLYISDHALVRYCERVLGLDKKAVIKGISNALGPIKDGKYKLPDQDIIAVIVNNTIVSFVPYSPNTNYKRKSTPLPVGKYVRKNDKAVLNDPEYQIWPEDIEPK